MKNKSGKHTELNIFLHLEIQRILYQKFLFKYKKYLFKKVSCFYVINY